MAPTATAPVCGVCGVPIPEPLGHPIHREGEPALLAVRERVDRASRAWYLFAMAGIMQQGLR